VGIAGDNVDPEWEQVPHRWDIRTIRNFMVVFGLMSTFFDLLTFLILLNLVGNAAEAFRTGWFVESLLSELLVLFIIRTYRPSFRSRPGTFIMVSSPILAVITLTLPYLPVAPVFGFVPLPPMVLWIVIVITVLYGIVSEVTKRIFYKLMKIDS